MTMKRYLYLNGKRLTKFDLAHLLDSILPAWCGNYWLLADHFTYEQLVEKLLQVAGNTTNRRLINKLSYYYPISTETPGRFFEDMNAYYR